MNFKKILPFIVLAVFIVLLFFYFSNNKNHFIKYELTSVNNIKYVKISGVSIKVDLAITEKEKGRGLSFRNNLKSDEGMLFIFTKPSLYSFWMKDMNFPIDIIWISEDLRVVYIKKNAMPSSYPESFAPTRGAKYILEVLGLFSEKNNLKEGDKVEFLSS